MLRLDVAKRHFEEALGDMGVGVVIAVEERAATGITHFVKFTGGDAVKFRAEVEKFLEPYTLAREAPAR